MSDLTERLQAWGDTDAEYGFRGRAQDLHLAATTLETLTQENARLREAGWRDIESAPKDGTEVLGWRDDCGALLMRWTSPAEFLTDAELAEWSEDDAHCEAWFYADFLQGGRLDDDEAPTHWMPLPPAPARKALGGGDV